MDNNVPESGPTHAAAKRRRRRRFVVLSKWSTVEFLISLLLLVIVTPFVEDLEHGPLIEGLLLTFMLVSAVLAVSNRWSTLLSSLALAVMAIVARWLHHLYADQLSPIIYLVPVLALLGFVLVIYLTYVLRAPIVTFGVLCAAVSMYLMLGLGWAMAYVLIANLNPTAFASSDHSTGPNTMNGFNAFYFSFVTLSTVGYGDIVPVSRTARLLAVLEATTGTLFVAMLIARLVSMHAASRSEG
jgi:hypothetical protein